MLCFPIQLSQKKIIIFYFQLSKTYDDSPEKFKSKQCFDSIVTYFLLSEGFKFNETNWDIEYMEKVMFFFTFLIFSPFVSPFVFPFLPMKKKV